MKRIIRLNASSIKESSCFRRLFFSNLEGYREKQTNNDIHYGSCFHKCAEIIELTGGDVVAGVQAAQELWRVEEKNLYVKSTKKFLTLAHLTMACQMYGQKRTTEDIFTGVSYLRSPIDNSPLVEQKFSIPLYEDANLLILLQGTIDGIVQIKNGCIAIADWKTTTAYNAEDYFEGYRLSPQLKTYFYGLNYYRSHYADSPIGNLLNSKGQIGAFIYGAFLSAGNIVDFKRSQLFWFNEQVMNSYQQMLDRLVSEIVAHTKEGNILPLAEGSFNGSCVSATGYKCKFFTACAAEANQNGDSSTVYHVLNSTFRKTEYLPLQFGGGNKNKVSNEKEPIGIESNVFGLPSRELC